MPNRILILSFTFPPSPSVGGRRWAKFAKYLHQSGNEVFVLAAAASTGVSSSWDEDIEGLNITRLKLFHPLHNRHKIPIIRKIIFKIGQLLLPLIYKGNIHDKTILSRQKILAAASQIIINQRIETLIITGAPFRALWFGTILKKQFPALNFIADLRDPWSWGHRSYGYDNLSSKRRAYEKKLEEEVVASADSVLVPVEPMAKKLCQDYPTLREKIILLPHGYDKKEIVTNNHELNPKPIKLVYFGTLYKGLEPHFKELAKAIAKYPNRFTLDIYSLSKKYRHIFTNYGVESIVSYHTPIPTKLLFENISKMNFALMFKLLDYGNDNISTKYYELIASRTPVLLIGPQGKASELISQHKLGFHIPVEMVDECFSKLAEGKLNLQYNKEYNIENYDFEKLSAVLINLIQNDKTTSQKLVIQ